MKRYLSITIFFIICFFSLNKICYSCDPFVISIGQNDERWVPVGEVFGTSASVISGGPAIQESWTWDNGGYGGLYNPSAPVNTTETSSVYAYAPIPGIFVMSVAAEEEGTEEYSGDECTVYGVGMGLEILNYIVPYGEDVDFITTFEPPYAGWTPSVQLLLILNSSYQTVAILDAPGNATLSGGVLPPGDYIAYYYITSPGGILSVTDSFSITMPEISMSGISGSIMAPGTSLSFSISGLPTGTSVTWSCSGPGSVTFSPATGFSTTATGFGTPGPYTISASYGSSGSVSYPTITVVGIGSISMGGSSISGPVFVTPGTTPAITVYPTSGSSFPTPLEWSLTGPGISTSGTSTDGNISLPTLTSPGVYTLTITCGSQTTTITITVFKVDIFDGTLNKIETWVGEDVIIYYGISPSGLTLDDVVLGVKDKDNNWIYIDGDMPKLAVGATHYDWSISTESLKNVHWNKNPYEIKIIAVKNGTSSYDTTTMEVKESYASVDAEKSPNTGVPVTECMEGREITFEGHSLGFINPVTITFFFQHANGTVWSVVKTAPYGYNNCDVTLDNVLNGNDNHNYDTPIHITVQDSYGHFATSNSISIKVWELWIDYIRDSATDKNWQVCLGDFIEYKGISAPYCKNWDWRFDTFTVAVQMLGSSKQGSDWKISDSYYGSLGNSYFGDTHGRVKVFCEDEEGNNHTFYSTDMNPTKKAKLFFKPELNRRGTTNFSEDYPPNWFYFWNQVEGVGDAYARYDDDIDRGQHRTNILNPRLADYIFIGRYTSDPWTTLSGSITFTGIYSLGVTVHHESTHRLLFYETHLLNCVPIPGIDDDGDWVKDSRETLGDLDFSGTLNTEDINGNGILDAGEDVGLIRKELTASELEDGNPTRNVLYGDNNGNIDSETGSLWTTSTYGGDTSQYHAYTYPASDPPDDNERLAYQSEESYPTTGYSDQDWSKGGEQW